MRLVEGGQEDATRSLVSVAQGTMGEIGDCQFSFLTTRGTMVGFTTLESQLSTERLTDTELALDTTLSGQMEEMRILELAPIQSKGIHCVCLWLPTHKPG